MPRRRQGGALLAGVQAQEAGEEGQGCSFCGGAHGGGGHSRRQGHARACACACACGVGAVGGICCEQRGRQGWASGACSLAAACGSSRRRICHRPALSTARRRPRAQPNHRWVARSAQRIWCKKLWHMVCGLCQFLIFEWWRFICRGRRVEHNVAASREHTLPTLPTHLAQKQTHLPACTAARVQSRPTAPQPR